jgi:TolA-binding protein
MTLADGTERIQQNVSLNGVFIMDRILILSIAAIALAAGCDQPAPTTPSRTVTSDDVRRDAGHAVDTAAEFAKQTKDEYQSKLDSRLAELDEEIVMLREKGSQLKDDAKVRWEIKQAELETKREAARIKLAEVKASSAEAWKDLQKGAQSAWDELDKAFRDASSEF